jgi:hypothetical protein
MKIQCSCGAKYAFDITPEMAQNPVRFVCPGCGLDSSEYVNQLVREELAKQGVEISPPPLVAAPRLKISHEEKPPEPAAAAPVSKYCQKHRGVLVTGECAVCHKPICPKCMEMFGFFCSPLCKSKADLQGIAAPVYAGQKTHVEARFWRKTGLIFGSIVALIFLFVGGWAWYAFFGSVPHPVFSVRFADDERAYSGRSQIVGQDQIIFLHGGTLARYDLKSKKQIWSQELITKQQIANAVKAEAAANERANSGGGYTHRESEETIERETKIGLQQELQLRISGQNVWVGKGDKLTHYDWDTGTVVREITLPESAGELVENGDELLLLGAQSVTHVNLASGDMRVERFGANGAVSVQGAGNSDGGLPTANADNGKPLDPSKVAAQAQNLKPQGRIALPALIANASHEQQLEAALNDNPQHPQPQNSTASQAGLESFQLVPGKNDFVQFSAKLLEERRVTRSAMKAPPKKSALDGDVNGTKTGQVANELLNEMQRNAGGDTVTEDESRYQVTVHLPDSPGTPDWTGEVAGHPQLFSLKTVNVIAAGKTVIVLDKSNKKLWQTGLTYTISAGGGGEFSREESKFGEGPCVEHGGTLYVFDKAVLSAFDLSTGNARWRLPSVGVVGLFFDDQGNAYVNTTSGNPDDIKYSKQIDIEKTTDDILMKVDSKTGKTLWSIKPGGFISYLSGKIIYTVQAYDPNPMDEEQMSDMAIQKPPYFRIARIDPKNGRILWEHYQDRVPFDVRFQDNSIELVFKREVQVLKFLSF